MSQPRPLHFWSIRNRIVLSVMGIVICTLAVTVLVSRHQLSQALDRSNYLKKHLNRFAGTKDYVAKSLAGVVTVIASDPGIISDLSCQPSAPSPSADKPDDATSPPRVCHRNRRWKQVRKSLAGTVAPELWLLTDKNDEPIESSKSSWNSTWLRQQSFYTQVARGLRLTAWVRAGKRTYLAAGAPVTGKGGQRLGTVIIAVDATRLLSDFAKLSDTVVKKRQNLMLVANGQVIASSIAAKTVSWAAQATSFAPKNQLTRAEGTRSVKVLRIAGHDYDFSTRPSSIFIKGNTTPATLVMFRQRTAHEVKQARFERPILWTGVGLVLLAGLVGLLLAYGIVKPLRGFIGYTKEMSSGGGDLTYRFPIARRDELGELASNLNSVLAQLQGLFDQVRQAALELGNSAAEISVTAGELFRRSQDESTKVEDITASVSTMNKAIQQLSVTAQQAAQRAGTGGSAVGEASTAIGEIRDVVSDISDQVRMLGDRSARIGSIVETIGQIADQTSLLALNASIEAAHAGEHGKGFAVVANEVSNLAERVNKSARQIEEQLAQIRLLTDKAVRSADTAATTVDKSVAQVDSTFGELQELLRLVQDIGAREQEQAQLSDEIARHMEDIFLLVREGLQANEQTVTEGERLKRLGEVLLTSVHQFKTSGTSRGGKSLEAPSQRRGLLGSGSGQDNA